MTTKISILVISIALLLVSNSNSQSKSESYFEYQVRNILTNRICNYPSISQDSLEDAILVSKNLSESAKNKLLSMINSKQTDFEAAGFVIEDVSDSDPRLRLTQIDMSCSSYEMMQYDNIHRSKDYYLGESQR